MFELAAKPDPILGGWRDGWEHHRDETGFCVNCGARPTEAHYRLVPKPNDALIYRRMVKVFRYERGIAHKGTL
jgi:hypothetical protein